MEKVWQHDWMSKWAIYSPDKVAVGQLDTGEVLTYGELNRNAEKLGLLLYHRFGLRKGDRIAVLDEMTNNLVTLGFACQKYGYILVPINYRLAAEEVSGIFRDADPAIIFVADLFRHLIQDEFTERVKTIEPDFLTAEYTPVQLPEIREDDVLFLIYTSGTTGKPKGVKYTHKMAFWNSINTSISLIINTETVTINVMPPFHTGGWNVLLMPILHHGGTVYMAKKFEASTRFKHWKSIDARFSWACQPCCPSWRTTNILTPPISVVWTISLSVESPCRFRLSKDTTGRALQSVKGTE